MGNLSNAKQCTFSRYVKKVVTFGTTGFQMVEMLGETADNDLPSLFPLPEESGSAVLSLHNDAPAKSPVESRSGQPNPVAPGGRIVQETTPLIP